MQKSSTTRNHIEFASALATVAGRAVAEECIETTAVSKIMQRSEELVENDIEIAPCRQDKRNPQLAECNSHVPTQRASRWG